MARTAPRKQRTLPCPGGPQPLHRAPQQAADRTAPECVGAVGSKMPALMLVFGPALRGMGVLIWVVGNVTGRLRTEQR